MALACRSVIAVTLALVASLLLLDWGAGGGTGRVLLQTRGGVAAGLYAVWPSSKMMDCFALGLQLYPLELAYCISSTATV